MIPTRSILRLPDGRRIDTSQHEVNVELTQLAVLSSIFTNEDHVNFIIDGVLEVLMARYKISYEDPAVPAVFIWPCHIEGCYCQSVRPLIVQTLLSETDVTVSDEIRSQHVEYLGWTRLIS